MLCVCAHARVFALCVRACVRACERVFADDIDRFCTIIIYILVLHIFASYFPYNIVEVGLKLSDHICHEACVLFRNWDITSPLLVLLTSSLFVLLCRIVSHIPQRQHLRYFCGIL